MAEDDRAGSSNFGSPSSKLNPPPSSASRPLPLAYDDLPPGSDVRREYSFVGGDGGGGGGGDGGGAREVKIIVPAGEPPPAVMRVALFDSFSSGARASWALLLLSFLLFWMGLRNNRLSG